MSSYQRPAGRGDFSVALVCALSLEFDAVCMVIDEFWDEDGDQFGKADGDHNTYVTGRIDKHNVVIVLLGKGKVNSATAATNLRTSYPNISLAILVGVCGAVPSIREREIGLGDVVISDTIVRYDFGYQTDHEFVRKKTCHGEMVPKEIFNLLESLQTVLGKRRLMKGTATFIEELKENAARLGQHGRYERPEKSVISASGSRSLPLALRGQAVDQVIDIQAPTVHFGPMASGDTVMVSAEHRDRIAAAENIVAFEMEGAGIWQELPCIIVKGVSDFADCEKTKEWQDYAAAMAAATSKAVLKRYIHTDRRATPPPGHSLLARQQGSNYGGTIETVRDVNQGNRMRISSAQPPRPYEQDGSSFMANIQSGAGVQQGNVMEFY
ncbi:MTA SAH nucleosidase [Fusarium subglutinans]|uniref:MTA SAH nucleosidase n=1 Tax=Gibberella subglutinans TaxID=42677 RepID=A0A8H5L3D8_GIBSU|nr:MTA SAH nucleosidase [Fusarium subglutinans]KAF5583055.1 MTA SAH nucleosidase [Fusarium subglutinans]